MRDHVEIRLASGTVWVIERGDDTPPYLWEANLAALRDGLYAITSYSIVSETIREADHHVTVQA